MATKCPLKYVKLVAYGTQLKPSVPPRWDAKSWRDWYYWTLKVSKEWL